MPLLEQPLRVQLKTSILAQPACAGQPRPRNFAQAMGAEGETAAPAPVVQKKGPSKPRIDCIDGCRFALVMPIVVAHFARFSTNNKTLLKVLTQENVLVGGFFVISGYVAAYTSTKLGERAADEKKLAKPELFFWQKVMGYYPLHFVILSLFTPMFVQVERWFKTPWQTTAFRAFLSFTMLQAWFPKEAEIWNQPTWFISALTFSNLTMPAVLPAVAELSKNGLKKLFMALTAVSLLQKLSFSETTRFHVHNVTKQTTYPLIWNLTRFHPFWALIEMTMGIVAVRNVMLDTEEDRKKPRVDPINYFLAAYGTLLLRLTPLFDFNDGIVRACLFVPMYTKFLTAVHRDCLSENPAPVTRFFGSKMMTYFGGLAFPMFILHGPIGQVFYKKILATRLWGKPMPTSFFPIYLGICLVLSHFLNENFVKNKKVGQTAGKIAQWLASKTEGMLQDGA